MKYWVVAFLLINVNLLKGQIPCVNGFIQIPGESIMYPCDNMELMGHLSLSEMGAAGSAGNDIWGWTDESSGREFVIFGDNAGTSFVEVSNPLAPVYLGFLQNHGANSSWKDMKTYQHYAYIVTENANQGVQIFDMNKLLSVSNPPMIFAQDGHFSHRPLGGKAHNIVSFVESGYMVLVGADNNTECGQGMEFINVQDPLNPVWEGCYNAGSPLISYTHDAVCFVYQGPDSSHIGKEICIGANENHQVIVDVTDKTLPEFLGAVDHYPNLASRSQHYTHQGWITDDQRYLVFNDELDEFRNNGINTTRTHLMNMEDLDNPFYMGYYDHNLTSIDHNCFVKGQYLYAGNYESGLRILDLENIADSVLTEVAYFDSYPNSTSITFNGVWGNYPFFKSGTIAISDRQSGLFLLRPLLPHFLIDAKDVPTTVCDGDDAVFDIDLQALYGYTDNVTLSVSGNPPSTTATFGSSTLSPSGSTTLTISGTSGLTGKHSLLISGSGPGNNAVHDIAVSFVMRPDEDVMHKYKDLNFSSDTTIYARDLIILEGINIDSNVVVTIYTPTVEMLQNVVVKGNGTLKIIEQDVCSQE